MASEELTARQQRFVEEYLIDLNATQAALRAGYSENNADKIGSQLLDKTRVVEAIDKAMHERSVRTQITQDRVLTELWGIATDDISNHLRFYTDSDGAVRMEVNDSQKTDTRNVKSVSLGKNGFRFEMYCRDNALVQVGKHLGMFVERKEFSGPGGGPIRIGPDLSKLPEERLTQLKEILNETNATD